MVPTTSTIACSNIHFTSVDGACPERRRRDWRNLPAQMIVGSNTLQYAYDAEGNRVKKNLTTGVETHYVRGAFGETLAIYEDDVLKVHNIFAGGELIGNYVSGNRHYFLKDHLGSVRSTVNQSGTVVGYGDYYPFGLTLPTRDGRTGSLSLAADKNKFTGYEKEVEGGVDLLHAGNRMYDPILGRFIQIDRFYFKYPSMSTYQYAANNPLYFTDINGDSLYVENRVNRSGFFGKVAGFFGFKRTDTYVYRGGDWVNKETGDVASNPSGFLKDVSQAVTDLEGTSTGSKLVSSLANGSKDVTIKKGSRNSFQGSINNATITFDPSSRQSGLNTAGNTNRPAFIGLGHELAHSYDIFGYDGSLGITPGSCGVRLVQEQLG